MCAPFREVCDSVVAIHTELLSDRRARMAVWSEYLRKVVVWEGLVQALVNRV